MRSAGGTNAISVAANVGQTWPLTVVENERAQHRRQHADTGEHQRKRELGDRDPRALAPERRQQSHAHAEIQRGEHEQRNRVEEDRLTFCAHRALLMIRSALSRVDIARCRKKRATWFSHSKR
jgi:hypothetical protein